MNIDNQQIPTSGNNPLLPNRYSIGLASLVSNISKQQICNAIGELATQMLQKTEWQLKNPQFWEHQKFQLLFGNIRSTENKRLNIYWHVLNQQRFLLLISIKFQQLIWLNLSWNFIDNIESLVFLNAPVLKLIGLNSNKITQVSKALNKFLLKSVQSISLETNPISQIQIGRFKTSFQPKRFAHVKFHYFTKEQISYNFLAKLDLRHGKDLIKKLSSDSAFYQRKDIPQLNQKTALKALVEKINR